MKKLVLGVVVLCAIALLASVLSLPTANAEGYPTRPISVIQPLGMGTPGDIASRAIAQSLSQTLGQPVVVENRTGANGIIAMEACAKAAPDGYTICMPSASQISINTFVYSRLPYDPPRDFAPVILIGLFPSTILVGGSVPVNSMAELIKLAKSKPGGLNYGSWGIGSLAHLYLAWVQSTTGTSFNHVPYKTIGEAMNALVAGEVQVMQTTPGLAQSLVKAGKIKALAVTGSKRSPFLPEVPSFKELGFDLQFLSWIGVFVPARTPKEIVMLLNKEIGKLIANPQFCERFLVPTAVDPAGGSPEEFAAFLKAELETVAKLAKIANLRPE